MGEAHLVLAHRQIQHNGHHNPAILWLVSTNLINFAERMKISTILVLHQKLGRHIKIVRTIFAPQVLMRIKSLVTSFDIDRNKELVFGGAPTVLVTVFQLRGQCNTVVFQAHLIFLTRNVQYWLGDVAALILHADNVLDGTKVNEESLIVLDCDFGLQRNPLLEFRQVEIDNPGKVLLRTVVRGIVTVFQLSYERRFTLEDGKKVVIRSDIQDRFEECLDITDLRDMADDFVERLAIIIKDDVTCVVALLDGDGSVSCSVRVFMVDG
mmetsp:Transcript_494/g.815  ORF Transcript_494/g.815 Transcript_494/m.815 type:complete len:267 (+) Transcript_494:255-1055(+)